MPDWEINGVTVKRKNLYMPCVLNADWDNMDEVEQVRVIKATYWADNITNGEWPVVLRKEEATKSNKSRLKRKASGWVMALARIAYLNPELFETIVAQARTMYADQVRADFPWLRMVPSLAGLRQTEPGEELHVGIYESEES